MGKKVAIFMGRFQPFHDGHKACIDKILKTHDKVTIIVRNGKRNDNNPYSFEEVVDMIEKAYAGLQYRIDILAVSDPDYDMTFYYGRKVGYNIKKISMPEEIERISATEIRKEKTT
jgi:adenylylsulfate kinase